MTRYLATKEMNTRTGTLLVMLGIMIYVVGFCGMITGHWYAIITCALIGGTYMVWSGYAAKKVMGIVRSSEPAEVAEIRYSVGGKDYIVIESDRDLSSQPDRD